jgi:hypothetical protein
MSDGWPGDELRDDIESWHNTVDKLRTKLERLQAQLKRAYEVMHLCPPIHPDPCDPRKDCNYCRKKYIARGE